MSDSHEATQAEIAHLFAHATACVASGRVLLRWLVRTRWMLRGIVLMNVVLGAWNAAQVDTAALPWLHVLGMGCNVLGAWHALKTEAKFSSDIQENRQRLQDLEEKIRNLIG